MRQTIAYIISAAVHIALAVVLFSTSAPKEETVIDLPTQLTIDFQAPKPEAKSHQEVQQGTPPVVKKTIKKTVTPTPAKETPQHKLLQHKPIEKAAPPTPLPEKIAVSEPKIDRNKKEESKPELQPTTSTTVNSARAENTPPPIVTTKRHTQAKSEPVIIHNPTYQSQRPIKYPRSAKRKKLQGTVIIRAAIDSNGRVQRSWVHESSGHSILDQSAMKSVQRWVFTPAQQGGLTIASTVQFPVVFQLR